MFVCVCTTYPLCKRKDIDPCSLFYYAPLTCSWKKRTSEVSPFSGCPGASPSSPLFQQHYTEERRLKEPRKYEADINFHLSRIQRVSHAGGHSIPSSLSSNFIPKIVSCSTLGGEQFSKIGFQLDTFFRDSFKGCRILLLKT